MTKSNTEKMKYLGAAVAVGGTMLLGTGLLKENKSVKKKVRKTANKALDTVDGIVNSIHGMIK